MTGKRTISITPADHPETGIVVDGEPSDSVVSCALQRGRHQAGTVQMVIIGQYAGEQTVAAVKIMDDSESAALGAWLLAAAQSIDPDTIHKGPVEVTLADLGYDLVIDSNGTALDSVTGTMPEPGGPVHVHANDESGEATTLLGGTAAAKLGGWLIAASRALRDAT